MSERTRAEINREIYELSEIEGDLTRLAPFMPFAFLRRLMLWGARQCAEQRAELRAERDEVTNAD